MQLVRNSKIQSFLFVIFMVMGGYFTQGPMLFAVVAVLMTLIVISAFFPVLKYDRHGLWRRTLSGYRRHAWKEVASMDTVGRFSKVVFISFSDGTNTVLGPLVSEREIHLKEITQFARKGNRKFRTDRSTVQLLKKRKPFWVYESLY